MRDKDRLLIFLTLLLGLPLVILMALNYISVRSNVTQKMVESLEIVSAMQKDRVTNYFENQFESVALIASRTALRNNLNEYNLSPSIAKVPAIARILDDAVDSSGSVTGVILRSVSGESIYANSYSKIPEPQAQELARAQHDTFLAGVYQDEVTGKVIIRILSPLVLERRTIGIIDAHLSADGLFERIVDDFTEFTSIQTLLVKKSDSGVPIIMNPTTSRVSSFTTVDGSLGSTPAEISLQGAESTIVTGDRKNYLGNEVYSSTRFIPAFGWGIVVNVNSEEIDAINNGILNSFFKDLLVLFLVFFAIVFVISRRLNARNRVKDEAIMDTIKKFFRDFNFKDRGFVLDMIVIFVSIILSIGLVIRIFAPGQSIKFQRDERRTKDLEIIYSEIERYQSRHDGAYPVYIPPAISCGEEGTEICRTGAVSCDGLVDLSVLIDEGDQFAFVPEDMFGVSYRGAGYYVYTDIDGSVSVCSPHGELTDQIIINQ